jgi:putative transposase
MKKNTVLELKWPASHQFQTQTEFQDSLTEVIRVGARDLIRLAVEAELQEFLFAVQDKLLPDGKQAVVRNGYQPEREIQTGVGPVSVRLPKTRDRSGSKLNFTSKLLPPYLRKTRSLEALLPWLYLKGVSTGDFSEALESLLGSKAKGLSAPTISRLKAQWQEERRAWSQSSLAGKRYVYWWVDGVYFNIRGDDARSCIFVIVGVTETGHKEFVAVEEGIRESEQSWLEILQSLKARGLEHGPKLVVGDGALGFWKAMTKVYGESRWQRCWVHKTANILNKLPKASQPAAKQRLHDIWMAETRADAEKAFDLFISTYQDKYPKAAHCLEKDREHLLTFYDFPAAHWLHIRTTNPVESTFATVRLRTTKTRGCVSRESILAMVYKLGMSAQKRWRRLRGFDRLADVITGVQFVNGEQVPAKETNRVAA